MTAITIKSRTASKHAKSPLLNIKEYDEPKMQQRFDDIAEAMRSRSEQELGFNPSDVTSRSLALLTGNLRAFVENALGKESDLSTRKITKFPHHLFFDYSPTGSLYVILCACLNFKYLMGLRRFEFSNIDKRSTYLDLLERIEKSLKQAKLLPMVKVFFANNVLASELPLLRTITQKRGAIVATASAATHIIYGDPSETTEQETAGTDYLRTKEVKGNSALVHWWYYPDSYDSWIESTAVDGKSEPHEKHKGPWHVQGRWLHDTDKFNEWMNEIDYEIPVEERMSVSLDMASMSEVGAPPTTPEKSIQDGEKSSKKRKRTSQSTSNKANSSTLSSGKPIPVKKSNDSEKRNINSESEIEEVIKKPRRPSDGAYRERKSKDHKDRLTKKESSDHFRKKARHSEKEKSKNQKETSTGSLLLKLRVRPPPEYRKERTKERTRDRERSRNHTRDTFKSERKDSASGRDDLKVRLKLGDLGDFKTSDHVDLKSDIKAEDSEMDDVSSVKSKTAPSTNTDFKMKRSSGSSKDLSQRKSGAPSRNDEMGNRHDGARDGEQKRPFSRRKTKKKERKHDPNTPGLTVVEDAIPIPEGELPRIRNISTHTPATDYMKDVSSVDNKRNPSNATNDNSNGTKGHEEGKSADHKNSENNADEQPMDIDEARNNNRMLAISEKALSADVGNAPPTMGDVVESLPPVTLRIPATSRWFRMDSIHHIEKTALPEFFDEKSESKTPLVYKKYRNFMVEVWRQTPDKYLTATSARRHLAGDVCAILRVHAFLEHWGLINFGVEPEGKPHLSSSLRAKVSRPRPVYLDGPPAQNGGGVPKILFFDDPLPPKHEGPPVSLQRAIKNAKEKSAKNMKVSAVSRRELYATAAATRYECDACETDCSRMRYHCVSGADMDLCPNCFANGEYPETLSARDFEQLTTVLSSEAYDGSVWSESEVMLLIEALEKFGDDWNQVASHVGTKEADQCVLQFLRMPLEDSFLEDQLGKWAPGGRDEMDVAVEQEGDCGGADKFAGPLLPFADTSNPIMAQVAFLASAVSPEVAAAAAQAALSQIMLKTSPSLDKTAEGASDRAAALLGTDNTNSNLGNANGTHPNSSTPQGSLLGSLPRTQVDGIAVEGAAAVGLASAAAKARELADAEVRELEREFAVVVETKLRSVDLKLQEFDRLEQHLRRERERLEKQRQAVYADRVEVALLRAGTNPQVPHAMTTQAGLQQQLPPQVAPPGLAHQTLTHPGAPNMATQGGQMAPHLYMNTATQGQVQQRMLAMQQGMAMHGGVNIAGRMPVTQTTQNPQGVPFGLAMPLAPRPAMGGAVPQVALQQPSMQSAMGQLGPQGPVAGSQHMPMQSDPRNK